MSNHEPISSYVIVGGGSAGWMSAAFLARVLHKTGVSITLVESPNIATVGVGEATVPSFVDFIHILGIPLADFVKATNATFKLGIKFSGWQSAATAKQAEHSYWHPFGNIGARIDAQPFFPHWLKTCFNDYDSAYTDYAPSAVMAQAHKFYVPDPANPNNLSRMGYALHFDATLGAAFFKEYATRYGVKHVSATVAAVQQTNNGNIQGLQLNGREPITGQFFIDCTGHQALLAGRTLGVAYDPWDKYLPVNAAVVVQSERSKQLPPYTLATAHDCGWQWRIPLQNRMGHGLVFCDHYCTPEQAEGRLTASIREPLLSAPRLLRFTTGKRRTMWTRNCVAIGLSAGFLEPLESTGLYLIMRAILNFTKLLPNTTFCPHTAAEFNRLMDAEYTNIRDFIVLHYCTSGRTDSRFWRDWRTRDIPDTLTNKLALYKSQGRLIHNDLDLFAHDSWYAVLTGMGIFPNDYDPLVDASDYEKVRTMLPKIAGSLRHSVDQLLSHEEFLQRMMAG